MSKPSKILPAIISIFVMVLVLVAFTKAPYELWIMRNFLLALRTELQEKIYLHTDRDFYEAGDAVWFRAWQVSAATHKQPGFSRFLYTELVDRHDSVIERVKIPYRDSLFAGYVLLDEKLPQGEYYLRAYSRWMQNLGKDFFFRKKIYVFHTSVDKPAKKTATDINDQVDKDFDIQFFPEGGNLLTGNTQMIAFKAVGTNGLSKEVRVEVYNEKNELLCASQSIHKGMGKFILASHPGERYYAYVSSEDSIQKKVQLPIPQRVGFGLSVQLTDSLLFYRIMYGDRTSFPENLYLLGHIRGIPLPELCIPLKQAQGKIKLKNLSEGVLHLLLVDTTQIYSQRLCFLWGQSRPEITLTVNRSTYRPREYMTVEMQMKRKKYVSLKGNFSVSVVDNDWRRRDILQDNIMSYLLLSSDLKGYIEEPAWYFAADDARRKEALDALLLTQGWTRFKIENVLRGISEPPVWPIELGQRISGRVKYFWSKKKDKSEIQLILFGANGYIGELHPDSTGHFAVEGLTFPEGTRFVIQGRDAKGKNNVEVFIDNEHFLTPHLNKLPDEGTDQQIQDFAQAIAGNYYYNEQGEKVYLLEEAIAKRTKPVNIQQAFYDSKSDFILDSARIALMKESDLATILRELPGIEMDISNKRFLRMGKGIPVIVDQLRITDLTAEFERLESMQGRDILQVNLLDPIAGRTLYDSDNGMLVITTRGYQPSFQKPLNRLVFVPMGYQLEAEFYMPRYEVDSVKIAMKDKIDKRKTIYWNPCINTDSLGMARFSFTTSDSGGPYFIIIEGILVDGVICRKEQQIIFN